LYFDDGLTNGGASLRQNISCKVTPNGVALSFGPREGRFRPWWKFIAVTVHGAQPQRMTIADQPRAATVVVGAQ
jgi:alpha-glucosidase